MPFGAAEFAGEECLDNLPGSLHSDNSAAQADHVHVVVFNALMRGKMIGDQGRPRPLILLMAMQAPTPLPHIATPRSTVPATTARARGIAKSG